MVSLLIPIAIAVVLAICVIFLFRKFSLLVLNAVTGLGIPL